MTNQAGGPIEVSLDHGRTYALVGHVTRPATENANGAVYVGAAATGSVALTGSTRLFVRTDPGGATRRSFAVHAAGEMPSPSAVSTDLPAGTAIFEALAPPLGTPLFLQTSAGLRPLPPGYVPTRGDILVFVAVIPRVRPVALIFENRVGGQVLLLPDDGRERVVATVRHPARGVGRYAATSAVPPGRIAEHHAYALLVSTSGAGVGVGRRVSGVGETTPAAPEPGAGQLVPTPDTRHPTPEAGGFRIEVGAATTAVGGTVMQVEPVDADAAAFLARGIPLDASTRVQMRVDEGPWMPLPRFQGAIPDALGAGLATRPELGLGSVRVGATHLRLLLGGDPVARRTALTQAVARLRAAAPVAPPVIRERTPSGSDLRAPVLSAPAPAVRGKLTITANVTGRGITYVIFCLDGRMAKATNVPPFTWNWDTRETPNGPHVITIMGKDADGNLVNQRTTRVRVAN